MTAESGIRTVRFAPFGRHTRYLLGRYLTHVLMVTGVLLAIALTIDLWPQFEAVLASGGNPVWAVVRYSALRTPWLIAPFLPFAAFLGVFWAELTLTMSGERMLIWNSGRSPLLCLAPVVLLGLILGAGEFVLDAYAGPASMAVQMRERLGRDGARLDRTTLSVSTWIVQPDGLLKTRIAFGPPAELRDLTYFRRNADGRVTDVETAPVARREPGSDMWVLQNGRFWTSRPGANAPVVIGTSDEALRPFAERRIALDLSPLWLTVYGMEPQYVPFGVLNNLTHSDRDPESRIRFQTRLNVLYGELVLPGAMALLAASLSMLLMAYATGWTAVVSIVFIGYMAHFATKACLLMGQTGTMSPVLAGWLVPVLLLAASVIVLRLAQKRRRAKPIAS